MPELPEETFVRALELLVTADRDWVPSADDHSLYLRPFMIATQRGIGISKPSQSYLFLVIASPAGPYFPGRDQAGDGLAVRRTTSAPPPAAPARPSAAATTPPVSSARSQALEHGCDQVVWLDATERRWVEEMGGMNLFFVYGSGPQARIVTPSLGGTTAGRDHQGLPAQARPRPRHTRGRGQDLGGRLARGLRFGRADRGVRLRHGRRGDPGRRREERDWAAGRSATANRGPSRSGCATSCSASSTAARRPPTAGPQGSGRELTSRPRRPGMPETGSRVGERLKC